MTFCSEAMTPNLEVRRVVAPIFVCHDDWKTRLISARCSTKQVREEVEATMEIIRDKYFLKSIMAGDEDFRAGRFKKWSAIREGDVYKR